MANRRNLKKIINSTCNEIFTDVIFISLGAKSAKENESELNEILTKIINLQDDLICRISHTEKGNVKAFYKRLKKDFNTGVNEISDLVLKLD